MALGGYRSTYSGSMVCRQARYLLRRRIVWSCGAYWRGLWGGLRAATHRILDFGDALPNRQRILTYAGGVRRASPVDLRLFP